MDRALPPAPVQRAAVARHAASLLVVRTGEEGPEVLMGVRGAGHRFMPNRLVFPGGAVDPGDATAPAATEPTPPLLAALARRGGSRLARALALCAARELEEETGLTLGTPPALDGMTYLCRAVTPARQPIRFNARFLVVDAARMSGVLQDTRELGGVGFRSVEAAIALDLAPVTLAVLQRYRTWMQVGAGPAMVYRDHAWRADR